MKESRKRFITVCTVHQLSLFLQVWWTDVATKEQD